MNKNNIMIVNNVIYVKLNLIMIKLRKYIIIVILQVYFQEHNVINVIYKYSKH